MSDSSRRRAPAIKLKIGDLLEGEFVINQDGSKSLHVKTDDFIRRARVLGEITSKELIESDESILLDVSDTTGTIKIKGGGSEWSSQVYLDMQDLKIGSLVDIIGLVRETSDGRVYIDCELCIPVNDSIKILRELEISKYYNRKGLSTIATKSIETAIKGQVKLNESDEIKNQILELLKRDENLEKGCSFDEIKRALGLTTKMVEPELRALQSDGDIFEPIAGTFKIV